MMDSSSDHSDNEQDKPQYVHIGVLREVIMDILKDNNDVNLGDNIVDLETKLFKELGIEDKDRSTKQRVQRIIFSLQKEAGIVEEQINQLPSLSQNNLMKFSKSNNVMDELKSDDNIQVAENKEQVVEAFPTSYRAELSVGDYCVACFSEDNAW